MALKMKIVLLFCFVVFWLYSYVARAQSCTCDLTSNACDVNCCCDLSCTSQDKSWFSRCEPINKNRVEKVCVSDRVLFSSNGKYQAEGTGGGLFCIFKDNYEARHFYSTVPSVTSLSDFDQLKRKYGTSSYASQLVDSPSYENSFKVGDPLFVLFSNNEQGYISLPTPFTNGICQDSNEAKFQYNNKTHCSRVINSLVAQCTTQKSWNALTYVHGFKIAPFPSFIFGTTRFLEISNSSNINGNKSIEIISVNDTRLIEADISLPLYCKDASGIVNNCSFISLPAPSFDNTTKACKNVVIQVGYSMSFTTNQTVALSTVAVSFVLGSIADGLSSFQQTFTTVFQEVKIGNATNRTQIANTTIMKRSGNPGYERGLPVISGRSFVDFLTQKTMIAVNQEDVTWLSTITATNDGVCSMSSSRTFIAFGVDYRSGCFISIKNVMTLAECQQLQKDIYSLVLRDLPTHIASFGNSNGEQIDEWIAVINNKPTEQASLSNGECRNIITGIQFDILYAKTGYFSNPQNKIVGFRVNYGTAHNLVFQCKGITCPSLFNIEIVQSVSFTDVSYTPQTEIKPKPAFKSKAPYDFFYPFL